MRIIITGGTGLIGRALAEDLAQAGHQVIVLGRRPGEGQGLPAGVRSVRWDGRTAEGWGDLADGADAIVNLAGENLSAGRWTSERKRAIRESRVNAGTAVVEAVQRAGKKPTVVIQASAVGYYGPTGDELLTEESPRGQDFLADVCREWEGSTQAVETLGIRRVVVRTGVVLSERHGALPRMLLPFRLFVGGPLGAGRQWMSWIHLQDQVRALRLLIETPAARGAFNLSATPLTNRQFASALGRVMRRPAFFPVPAVLIRLMFGEMGTVVLDGQRVSARRLTDLGFTFHFSEAESALRDLLRRGPVDGKGG
jgi:uncharacterized protein